jgi:DNA-binding LacI/PurR family transcriptional regulator
MNLKKNIDPEFSHEDSLEELKNKIIDKFSKKNNIKGIISGSDVRTLVIISTLQELGYTINKDVFIVSKSYSTAPNYYFPKIPYFHEDMELTGYKLGDFLLKRIAGTEINELQHVEKNKFIKNDELFDS